MRITPTKIKDVLLIEPNVFEDHRGWFAETYHQEKFKEFGIDVNFVQHNHSFTYKSGTLRGLHFQEHPHTQAKLVRCTRGAVLDVAVDLRKNSPTYKQWVAVELTEHNKRKLFIPKGFAHGFVTLTDNTEFQYKVDNYYNKDAERVIRFDDQDIGINWEIENPILIERDKNAPYLKDCDINFEWLIMKILVTGGAGFIGSNFIIYMMNKYPNYEIVNLDKLTYAGNLDNLKEVEKNKNYTFIHGDICDKKIVSEAMSGCDLVVHFAAESHVDRSISEPSVFIQTNVLGTETLLEVAHALKIKRFHHVSTDEVFGTLSLEDTSQKFNELTPYSPRSPYSASKAGSDHLVKAFIETYNFPATISNCTNNYGPFQFPEKIIPLFITNAFNDKPLPIYGKGLAVRDYLYVTDHCEALDLIIHKGKVGETYCIGGDSEKNGLDISDTILEILNKPKSLKQFVEDRKGHDMRYAMDHSKITRELGWRPAHSFEAGMRATIKWYQDNEHWWQKLITNKN